MRSGLRSVEWILAASAALFFVFGKYIAPYYEGMFEQVSPDEEPVAISFFSLCAAGILFGLLVARLFWRLRRR